MEQELQRHERRLNSRERNLDEREKFVNEKYETALNEKEHAIELTRALSQNPVKSGSSEFDKEIIHQKDKTIEELKKENRELRAEIICILKKIDRQTEKSAMDSILPYITPALLGIFLLKDQWKEGNNKNIDPELIKLIEMFMPKTKEEQEKLKKELQEIIKKGQIVNNSGQKPK